MTDRLSIYNGALAVLGERTLASLTEDREPRRKLDDIWDRDGVETCLETAMWKFAIRSQSLTFSPSVSPAPYGYANGFEIPSDHLRTTAITTDEFYKQPLIEYNVENGYWWAQLDTIFIRYVSSDDLFGFDYSKWTKLFTRYVEHYFAIELSSTIKGFDPEKKEAVAEETNKILKRAKAVDAMEQPVKFPPVASWVRARRERRGGDLGSRSRLIG